MSLRLLLAILLTGGQVGAQDRPMTARSQTPVTEASAPTDVATLPFPPEVLAQLKNELDQHDYSGAQALLLKRLGEVAQPEQRRALLLSLGSTYYLAHDPLQAAVAWQKAASIGTLPEQIRFSQAMAYIQIHHQDWAMSQLTALHQTAPQNALYLFWMGRIAYDEQKYSEAAEYFRDSLKIDPVSSRTHDNLGLCLFDLNDVEGAVREHQRAIDLQQGKRGASAWPYLNLGIAEEFRGRSQPAMQAFQQALILDPSFAQAHYHLGNLYATAGRLPEALQEFELAAKFSPVWAEPHASLARVYRRLGDKARAEQEVQLYEQVKEKSSGANEHH